MYRTTFFVNIEVWAKPFTFSIISFGSNHFTFLLCWVLSQSLFVGLFKGNYFKLCIFKIKVIFRNSILLSEKCQWAKYSDSSSQMTHQFDQNRSFNGFSEIILLVLRLFLKHNLRWGLSGSLDCLFSPISHLVFPLLLATANWFLIIVSLFPY